MLEYIRPLMSPEIIIIASGIAVAIAVAVILKMGRVALTRDLEGRLAALNEEVEGRRRLVRDLAQKETACAAVEARLAQAEARLSALSGELKPIEEKHQKALLDYEDAKARYREEKDKWLEMQDRVQAYEASVKKLAAMEEQIKTLDEQKKELEKTVIELPKKQEEFEKLKASIAQNEKERANLDTMCTDLRAQKATAEKDIREAKAAAEKELRDAQAAGKKELEELQNNIKEAERRLKQIETAEIQVAATLDEKRNQVKRIGHLPREAFRSLRANVFEKVPPDGQGSEDNESALLERVQRTVSSRGYELPVRLQEAFHTALKTADISCLTVMAGVSGTGKSAFPKLYAEATGIHFLPLAVEPRWDSPQDLFGFLNYMESRYEPTTLARALVQFNGLDFDGWKKGECVDLSNYMLMVLLDEMNLARVEYYFSEFLSRLEMRRDVDPKTLDGYRKVSMEVYGGHGGDSETGAEAVSPIRLFAGSNVLFVGTMNEDESTQSLSDKVIDRANVLYFGKPPHLHVRGTNGGGGAGLNTPKLTYEIWRNWIRNTTEANIPQFGEVTASLANVNAELAKIGRPFGHRAFQAMLSYVANHPSVALRHEAPWRALADQVAMRVMPKLRGVDLVTHDEVFQSLGVVIETLHDSHLLNAFDQARRSSRGYFEWRGFEWGG